MQGRRLGVGFPLHNDVVVPYFLKYATDEQKQRWLPPMCSGETITAIAMTEPGTGSDLAGVKTTAIAQDDGSYLLNGAKTFITNGITADLVIVVAKTDPDAGTAASRCCSSSAAWRASSAAASSRRSAWPPRTPPSCSSTTCGSRPRTSSARRARASST
jgi:hypothetical protein